MTKFAVNCLSIVFLCSVVFVSVQAQYEDVRCKCICPSVKPKNGTGPSKRIFVRSFRESGSCNCENVVDKELQESQLSFCNLCECAWQRRNTTTIKVVVMLIICIVALLFLYMLFLLCLDPLMSRRPKTYFEQHNEEDTQSVQIGGMLEGDASRPRGDIVNRMRHEVSRVREEQQKWKGNVQEQRRHIYDRRTMLN